MIRSVPELIRVSHEMAKEKGWWPEEGRSWLEIWVLLHSEVSEAFEEYRSKRTETWFNGDKPEGFFVEIADLAIRLADVSGYRGWTLDPTDVSKLIDQELDRPLTYVDFCAILHDDIGHMLSEREADASELCYSIFRGSELLGHDLWESINTKLNYNKTRPFRHGNKVA